MKKILLLLLLATFSIQAQTLQNPTYGNVKLKNNTTDNSATKVNVQSTDGTINTISKSDLVNVVEVNDVPSLPLTGVAGKIYVVKNVNKIYRWNGTFYQELAGGDISGLQAQIDLKANLASPSLTGTPTAPTATVGTNTTQIATTAFVTSAINTADSGNVKLTGNQTITGVKTFNTSTASTSILSYNNSTSSGITSDNSSTGEGFFSNNTSTGTGFYSNNSSTGRGIASNNSSTGRGISSNNTSTGTGISSNNTSTGNGIVSNSTPTGTGFNYVGQNNGTNTFTVNKLGATTATSFINSTAPANNILLAGGGDLAQASLPVSTATQTALNGKENAFTKNTAFNKNFGTTAGTVVEGNDSRILNGQTAFGWGNHAGLYPSLTGTGATGTWGINISGNSQTSSALGEYNWNPTVKDNADFMFGRNAANEIAIISQLGVRNFLGLGSNAYNSTAYLPLSGGTVNGSVLFNSTTGGVVSFQTNSLPSALMTSSQNIIIGGSTTDFNTYVYGNNPYNIWTNGVKRVTVSGSGNVDFTGTVTAPTAPAGTNTTQIATTAFVLANSRPYKVYTALVSQTGTNAPTATALENTLGGSVAWSRIGSGVYLGELTGAFVNNKTWSSVSIGGYLSGGANSVALKRFDNNSVILITNKDTLSSDNILDLASIEIRVYN